MPKKSHFGIIPPKQANTLKSTKTTKKNNSLPADIEKELREREKHAEMQTLKHPNIK